MKRAIAAILAVLMMIQLLPATGETYSDWIKLRPDETETPVFHTVRFVSDGEEISAVSVADGGTTENLPNTPEPDGKEFLGWYDGDSLFTAETIITEDKEIEARYREEQAVDVFVFPGRTVCLKDIASALGISIANNSTLSVDHASIHLSDTKVNNKNKDTITLTAGGYFDHATLTIRKNKNQVQTVSLAYPEPEVKSVEYTFEDENEQISLLSLLPDYSVAIAEVRVTSGNEDAIELLDRIGDYTVVPIEYFAAVTLSVLTREGARYEIILHWPGEEAALVEGALYYNESLYLTGKIPGRGIIDAVPVTVSVDGEEVLAAYDIRIYANENQQKKGKTWQPAGEKVQVHFFDKAFAGKVNVYHIDSAAPEYVDTVTAKDGWVAFEAESFSTYAVTKAIEKTVEIGGNTYHITVTYGRDADIPDGAELAVAEVSADAYLEQAADALGMGAEDEFHYARFLDISILYQGATIEPKAPVDVTVSLLDVTDGAEAMEVVHFTENGAEKVESEASADGIITFTTDSFSTYGFGSILRSLLSWTSDAISYTLQGFSSLLRPTYTAISVAVEEGLEMINAYNVQSTLGNLLNALYVKVSTALNLDERESVIVYAVRDGEIADVLSEGGNVDESIALGDADGFAVVKDTGFRRRVFDLGAVELNGMMPKAAEAEAVDVAGEADSPAVLAAYDISIMEGRSRYQPDADHPVEVSITGEGISDTLVQIWHILDDGTREQITDFTVDGDTVIFTAPGFSVYQIIGDTNAKYVFHNLDGSEFSFTNKNGDATTFQHVAVGGTLYNPGTPEGPEGGEDLLFWGWWTKDGTEWGEMVIPGNVESVNPDLSGLAEGECTVIDLYPRFEATYYLVYHDETMTNILATEVLSSNQNVTLRDENGELRVQCILSGEDSTDKAVLGWGTQPNLTTDEDVLADPFSFEGGVLNLYPVLAEAYWISFDKNDWEYTPNTSHTGDWDLVNGEYVPNAEGTGAYNRAGTGASYVAPRFVLRGETYNARYNNDVPVSTRPGYEFQGWYYDKAFTQPFNPNATPTENVTVYAKWEPQTVPYTVQYWLQNANGDGYTLADVELKLWAGTTGTDTAVTPDALTKTVNNQGQLVDGPAVKDKYAHYKLHTANPADEYTIQNEKIEGDESTVINVYYDCQTYTLRFIYARSGLAYSETNSTSGTLYGYVDGQYVMLTRGPQTTTTEYYLSRYNTPGSAEYTDTVYDANSNVVTNPVYGNTYYRRTRARDPLYWLSRQVTAYTWTYTDSNGVTQNYDGPRYTPNSNLQYQITPNVHNHYIVNNNTSHGYSQSWSSIPAGLENYNEGWTSVSSKPQVEPRDNYVLGSFSQGSHTYYYVDIVHIKYGEDISGSWPYNTLLPIGNYKFTSWGTQVNSPYWLKKENTSTSLGRFTIKGAYNNLDDDLINAENNGNTIVNGTDLLAHVFLGRYQGSPTYYNYHIYADLLDGETGERNWNGEPYAEYRVVYGATSTDTLRGQAVLAFAGLRNVGGPVDQNGTASTVSGGSSAENAVDVYFYYKRVEYDLNIFRNHEGDTYTEPGETFSTQKVKFGQDITGYLENANKNHLLAFDDYVVGETTYTAASGEQFVFTGWYSNPEGLGDPVDLTGLEMTADKFIYAGWRPIRYRVWIQPNGGELSGTESTWFNLDYGETVGAYSDITRDYLRDPEGEYIYVIYDHEAPRTAQYVKLSEATDDQIAHALKDGENYIRYSYMKNAYTFVGWYEVLDEDFGTYEQYYANGNSNDGTYTVRPPTINESDKLSAGTYVFGTPVIRDIALRAIWKRAGTIALEFDPLTGSVPREYAAKETTGEHAGEFILHYAANGQPDQWSANPEDDELIYPLTEQIYADLSNEKATYAPNPPPNHYFVGWKTPYGTIVSPNDIFTVYVDLAEYMGESASNDPWYRYRLTAVYAKLESVDLLYDANGGTGTLTDYGTQEGNESLTTGNNKVSDLILNNPVVLSDGSGFTREGYVLVGWSETSGDNNPLDYELGDDNVFIDDEDSTLYAVWRRMILDVNVYKYGQQESGEDAPLAGAGFSLNGTAASTTPAATSASNGLVQFENVIPTADTLTLCETSVPAGTNYQLITDDLVITYEPETDTDGGYVYKTVGGVEYISATVTGITCGNPAVLTQEDVNNDGTADYVIHNKFPTMNVDLEKFVTGNMADTAKPFSFTVSAEASFTITKDGTVTASSSGTATVALRHGETAVLTLPVGATVTITETPEGYTASVTGENLTGTQSGSAYTFEVPDTEGGVVTFTNELAQTVDTGVPISDAPCGMTLLLGLAGLALMLCGRRRRGGVCK